MCLLSAMNCTFNSHLECSCRGDIPLLCCFVYEMYSEAKPVFERASKPECYKPLAVYVNQSQKCKRLSIPVILEDETCGAPHQWSGYDRGWIVRTLLLDATYYIPTWLNERCFCLHRGRYASSSSSSVLYSEERARPGWCLSPSGWP